MPERPLLILPSPGQPGPRRKLGGGAPKLHQPSRESQGKRLAPRLEALEAVFDAGRARLRTGAAGLEPEQIVVLETAGPIDQFFAAVKRIPGLEWLTEIEQEDIPPDDDFFRLDTNGRRKDEAIRGRVFLVLANQQARRAMRPRDRRALPASAAGGAELEIAVSSRADAGALETPVPYALAVTLEVAEDLGIEIYDEVRARIRAKVQVAAGTS
jgi:hypothetical protein